MNSYFREYGSSSAPPLVILHGLLGSSDNWHSFSQRFSEHFHTYALYARNHGRSPHSDHFNYQVMAEDVVEFMAQHRISSTSLMGHSMGGKTAALISLLYPECVQRLIVIDIAPRVYTTHHDQVFDALLSLDVSSFKYRKDIDETLSQKITDVSVRQFLMKNLMRDNSGRFHWKMNFAVIEKNYTRINEELPQGRQFHGPTLFICGENSDYIQMKDLPLISQNFPKAQFVIIKNAGHWVHMDAQEEFSNVVLEFLSF
jgi:esterase